MIPRLLQAVGQPASHFCMIYSPDPVVESLEESIHSQQQVPDFITAGLVVEILSQALATWIPKATKVAAHHT